jgi:hypothetical protein
MRRTSGPLRRVARRFPNVRPRERIQDLRRQIQTPMLRLRTRQVADLDALARLHGTDKSSWFHGYTRLYERHLSARRTTVRRLLEIGVGGIKSWRGYETPEGGQSLRMWSDYFPNAEVIGIDIHAKEVSGPRIRFEQGDQSDPDFLQALIEKYAPFDIVIDDGSHIGRHIIASFGALWSALVPGGIYAIEDLALAYDPRFEGGPPGTPGTAAELIKGAVDDTLLREDAHFRPSIAALHVYGGIAFFEKGR